MDKCELEVLRIGGEKMLNLALEEFQTKFHIVAQTAEYLVLGNENKNVSFTRGSKLRVKERYFFDKSPKLDRKR